MRIGGHAVIIIMKSWTEEVPPRSIRGRVLPWDDYNSKWNCDGPKMIMIVTKVICTQCYRRHVITGIRLWDLPIQEEK